MPKYLVAALAMLLCALSHSAEIPISHVVEAQTYCVSDELSSPHQEIEDSIESIPHCVTFSNGKAVYSPRGGMLANSQLFSFDYSVSEQIEPIIEVHFEEGKHYRLMDEFTIELYGIVYKRRVEVPNPGYLISTQMTHRVLIDTRQLDVQTTIELYPGPNDEAEECTGLPLELQLVPGTVKTYELQLMCGKGYGTYLKNGAINQDSRITSVFYDSRLDRGLTCSGHEVFEITCEAISF